MEGSARLIGAQVEGQGAFAEDVGQCLDQLRRQQLLQRR